jgi:CHASE3 domain sensor protein
MKMKKINLLAFIMFITLSASPVFAAKTSNASKSPATETESRLTTEEVNTLTSRVNEIRDMDKSNLSASEKSELKSELKEIKETIKSEPYIYIGGGTLILIIILLIILL